MGWLYSRKLSICGLFLILVSSLFLIEQVQAQQSDLSEAIRAVVRIRGCNVTGCNVGLGSGVLIHESGVILTANHVTLSDFNNPLSPHLQDFVIEVTDNPRLAPNARYRARLIAVKAEADLALLQIYWDEINGRPLAMNSELALPLLPLADVNNISLGEPLHILGYPLTGGKAINYSKIELAGFDEEGALLKAQVTLDGGYSGGPALVMQAGRFAIAGIVASRRENVTFIHSIDQLHHMLWETNAQRVWAENIQASVEGNAADTVLKFQADIHAIDYTAHTIQFLAYAFDAETQQPFITGNMNLPHSANGQLVIQTEFTIQRTIERLPVTLTLPMNLQAVPIERLEFRLAIWDAEQAHLLWRDEQWRTTHAMTPDFEPLPSVISTLPLPKQTPAPTPSYTSTPTFTATETREPSATPTSTSSSTFTAAPRPIDTLAIDLTETAVIAIIEAALRESIVPELSTPSPTSILSSTINTKSSVQFTSGGVIQLGNTPSEIAYSPDGRMLAVATNVGVAIYEVIWVNNRRWLRSQNQVISISWSPDSSQLASTSGNNVQIWQVSDQRLLYTLEGHTFLVNSVSWSPDGHQLASASNDGTVRIWKTSDGTLLHIIEDTTGQIYSVDWSPDSRLLASGSNDGTVRIWHANDGTLLRTLDKHTGPVKSVNWSPDGREIASGSWDKTVCIWQVSDGALLHTLVGIVGINETYNLVNSVRWSPSGNLIASLAEHNKLQIWEVNSETMLRKLEGEQGVSWSPNGNQIASSAQDGTIRFWNVSQ